MAAKRRLLGDGLSRQQAALGRLLAGLLIARYGVAKIIKRKKRAASVPADDAVYRELAEHCDLVITGSGD